MNYNGFPATYQPYYQQPQNNGIIWVSGEAGAKAYLVAPNSTVQLWDSESQTIYLKSADPSGMPSMKILDYTIRQNAVNAPNSSVGANDNLPAYATKSETDAILAQIEALKGKVDKLIKKHKEETEDDE